MGRQCPEEAKDKPASVTYDGGSYESTAAQYLLPQQSGRNAHGRVAAAAPPLITPNKIWEVN